MANRPKDLTDPQFERKKLGLLETRNSCDLCVGVDVDVNVDEKSHGFVVDHDRAHEAELAKLGSGEPEDDEVPLSC